MPALIRTAPLPDYPDCTAYQITGSSPDEVQDAVTSIMNAAEDIGGEAHFHIPARTFVDNQKRWRATGYVRDPRPRRPLFDIIGELEQITRPLAAAE